MALQSISIRNSNVNTSDEKELYRVRVLTQYLFIFHIPKSSSCCMRKIIQLAVFFQVMLRTHLCLLTFAK